MTPNCFRCDKPIPSPVEDHAHYVIGDDMTAQETVEVARAFVVNDSVSAAIDTLGSHYPTIDRETLLHAVVSNTDLIDYLGLPPENNSNAPSDRADNARAAAPALTDFDTADVQDVADAPPDTAKVERVVEQRTVQKTGLIHKDELQDTDEIIW